MMREKNKYHLAKWIILCQPKDQGGLGIYDLQFILTKTFALLSKWLCKLLIIEGIWQQLLSNKYLGSKPLIQVEWKNRLIFLVQSYEGEVRFFPLWIFLYKRRNTSVFLRRQMAWGFVFTRRVPVSLQH